MTTVEGEEELVCYTAPGKVFASRGELLEHYKSDWHRYNLKRKVAKLPPLSFETFSEIQARAQQRQDSKQSQPKRRDHVKARNRKKHADKANKAKRRLSMSTAGEESFSKSVPGSGGEAIAEKEKSLSTAEVEESAQKEYSIDLEEAKKPVNPCQSIFDFPKPMVFASVEQNLAHMQKKFGYFLPDCEYIVDVEGLVKYCMQKVRVGKLCLYCDKAFHSGNAAIAHMVDKSHCKIRWDSDEDMEEFEDFYDFSKATTQGEESNGLNDEDSSEAQAMGTMEHLSSGELKFTDADGSVRLIGTREFRKYYKQRFKPEDTRPSIVANVANTSERLVSLYAKAGVNTSSALSLARFKSNLYSKEERKQVQQQRRRQHYQAIEHLRNGLQVNLHVKNRVAKKNVGEGSGVHG